MQAPVAIAHPREHGMMVEPDHADVKERSQEGDVSGPLSQKLVEQASGFVLGTNNLEHQERDRYREDTVAEGFESVRIRQAHLLLGPVLLGFILRATSAANVCYVLADHFDIR